MTPNDKEEVLVIYRPFITKRNGERLYASQVGKKAFRIVIKVKKPGNGK